MHTRQALKPETMREIRKWIIQSAFGIVAYGLVLFLLAGRLDWVWGWIILTITAVFLAAHPIILIPINPELLAERESGFRQENVKAWDRYLGPAAAGMGILVWVVAGLDIRFQWTGSFPLPLHLAGLVAHVAGYGLFLWAMASNTFFAEAVRIQDKRDHQVAAGGPYRVVRHPGYAGAILSILASPFLLGSWWGGVPALIGLFLYCLRTSLEDKVLLKELPGYADYAARIRFRLIPGVW